MSVTSASLCLLYLLRKMWPFTERFLLFLHKNYSLLTKNSYAVTQSQSCFHYIITILFISHNLSKVKILSKRTAPSTQSHWERMFYESNELWVVSQWVIWKNKSFGRNNKMKHYFYLICPLNASLLPAHARLISDMKSQPGLFVGSILGPATTATCMPQKIAFPDTLQEPFKPSGNPYC